VASSTEVLSLFCCADLSLQLVAQGPQLVDFGDDAALFGERRKGQREVPVVGTFDSQVLI